MRAIRRLACIPRKILCIVDKSLLFVGQIVIKNRSIPLYAALIISSALVHAVGVILLITLLYTIYKGLVKWQQ